jgi:hypothetical protein
MSSTDELERLKERVAGRPGPVLSVYLSVNPASVENRDRAYALRLKSALKENAVPRALARRVLEYVEAERPRMHTLALFATDDGPLEAYWLRAELPEKVRWGEPHLAPLELVIEKYRPTGVVLLDARRLRFFVASLGDIEEEMGAANLFDTAGWREVTLSPSSPNPRGGAAREVFEHRIDAWTRRFYRNAAGELQRMTERLGVRRLILAGPEERTSEFRTILPNRMKELVAAAVHLPVAAAESELLNRLNRVEERLEQEEEQRLMAEAGERGVRGLEETLRALHAGRVYRLVAPWPLEGDVRWCDSCALPSAAKRQEDGSCPYCGRPTRERSLSDAVLDLAAARDAPVEFVRGKNADLLQERLGGLAGLTRF